MRMQAALGRRVLTSFAQGEVGEIWLAYTSFINTVVHEPRLIRLLPVSKEDVDGKGDGEGSAGLKLQMNFEAEEESILEMLIPKYMISMIYGGLLEAAASENGARMQAMVLQRAMLRKCWEDPDAAVQQSASGQRSPRT